MVDLYFIGNIQSSLKTIDACPLQESEGAPQAVIQIHEKYWPAMSGLKAGSEIIVFTWLLQGNRETLALRPRNDAANPMTGVFATRSNDRPNPIGMHHTKIVSVDKDGTIRISNIEVLDGTPVVDIKPVI